MQLLKASFYIFAVIRLLVLLHYFPQKKQLNRFFLQFVIGLSDGHGRMRKPASRASMWRDGYPTPPDTSDNQGFCGGFMVRKLFI